MNDAGKLTSIAVLGGSFNPLHLGHLRLAVEVYEAVKPGRLDFVPCANPPHKRGDTLLPFKLRMDMLVGATAAYPMFSVNGLEAERDDFSFTSDTLREYARMFPGIKLYFILGTEDFEYLDTWKEWPVLPELAEFLVVARQGREAGGFAETTRLLWPDALEVSPAGPDERPAFSIGKNGRVSYLALPRLDINASLVRSRWLWGRMIDFWVPGEVLTVLDENAELVKKHWLG